MSYLPIPPRVWSRVQNQCTYIVPGSNYTEAFIPLTGQTVSQAQANYEDKLIYKGNILQYKGNSAQLTKTQKYTQLAKGGGPNRRKVTATQSQTYTNPNTTGLQRVNYNTIPFPNQIVGAPNNISGPYQYGVPNPNGCSGTSLQDGGTLVCGTLSNPCTGEIIKAASTSATICNPASASNVPGSSILCWNNKVQTWFPKPRYTMNNSTSKWPQGYKGFVSAVDPSSYTSCLNQTNITGLGNLTTIETPLALVATPLASSTIATPLPPSTITTPLPPSTIATPLPPSTITTSLPPSTPLPRSNTLDVEDLYNNNNTTTTTTTTNFIPIQMYYIQPENGYIELPDEKPKYGIFKMYNQTGEFMEIRSTYIIYNISYAFEGKYIITNFPPNTTASFIYLQNSIGETFIQANIF